MASNCPAKPSELASQGLPSRMSTDPTFACLSYSSSPESAHIGLRSPNLEEEGGCTGSEAATNEPLTPIHPPQMLDKLNRAIMKRENPHTFAAVEPRSIIIPATTTFPTTSVAKRDVIPVGAQETPKAPKAPKTLSQKRITTSTSGGGKDSNIKRAVSGFFRSSNSYNSQSGIMKPMIQVDGRALATVVGSDPILSTDQPWLSTRRMSATNSPSTTRSNTPLSPGFSIDNNNKSQSHISVLESSERDIFAHSRKMNRSSTGFGIRRTFSKHKISFATPHSNKDPPSASRRYRATSVDLDNSEPDPNDPGAKLPPRQIWGMAADTGTGLKARRMSLSLPDDFLVNVIELYTEYSDQSKMVGRRGKSVGKGATANVHLMSRKGCPGEVYAVKEFRGKSTTEQERDYEQKVKSEYSIARSVHHPNIVETFRLCTHNGRWNQVMEFCDQGDLFNLVSQKYLSKEDRLVDRLCLFKQLVQGLNYLHNNGIAHRDVKLENLLITKDSKLKITDFGVSEVFAGIHPGLRSAGGQCGKEMGEVRLCSPGMCGSPPYVAPEVIAKEGAYDPRPLDVWGAAIVMLCMCANGVLWQEAKAGSSHLYDDLIRGWTNWNNKHTEAGVGITETDYPYVTFFDQHINPPALRRVLLTMLNPDPSRRAPIATVAKNRWLKNVECCQIDSYDGLATVIDVSRSRTCLEGMTKMVHHNHLPPYKHIGHSLVRLPGSTHM